MLQGISDGASGTNKTLRLMRQLVQVGKRTPVVIETARQLTANLPQKDYPGESHALFRFVRDRIRYVRDPNGVEALARPETTLQLGSGDCDDKVILLCSLLESIGHDTRLVAMKQDPRGPYCHVFAETKLGAGWCAMETTEPWPLGRSPAPFGTPRMTVYN
jgi:transglutaminase-like putative cysteine protease